MFRKLKDNYGLLPLQAKASLWFLGCSFLQKSVSALTTPVFTRLFSEAEYGRFNVFLSWQSLLQTFVTLNLFAGVYSAGLIKFKERRNEFISSLQGLTLTMIVLWGCFYSLFQGFFNRLLSLSTVQVLCMLAIFWTEATFNFWSMEQRIYYHYRKLVIITFFVTALQPATAILMISLCPADKVTARIVGIAIARLCSCSWMFVTHMRRCGRLFSSYFWRYALKFNIPLIPHYLSQSLLNSADRIMIERMASAGAAGIYSLAYSVAVIMNLFSSALTQALSPWVYENIRNRKEREISTVLLPSVAFIAFVNLTLILFAPEIVRIFAPPSYYEAIWTIPPVVMSAYFSYLYTIFSYYEFYYEKTSFIAGATAMAAVANLILNYICIRHFGYVAAGYTTLVCYTFYSIGHWIVMKGVAKEFLDGNAIVPLRQTALVSIAFMGIGFFFCALYNHPLGRYATFLSMCATAFIFRKSVFGLCREIMGKVKRGNA